MFLSQSNPDNWVLYKNDNQENTNNSTATATTQIRNVIAKSFDSFSNTKNTNENQNSKFFPFLPDCDFQKHVTSKDKPFDQEKFFDNVPQQVFNGSHRKIKGFPLIVSPLVIGQVKIEGAIYFDEKGWSSVYNCKVDGFESDDLVCKISALTNKQIFEPNTLSENAQKNLKAQNPHLDFNNEDKNQKLYRLFPGWMDAMGWSKANPNEFYGSFNFAIIFCEDYSVSMLYLHFLIIKKYKYENRKYMQSLLKHTHQISNYYYSTNNELLDLFAQLFFCVLAPLKFQFGFCHNDAKLNNVMFDYLPQHENSFYGVELLDTNEYMLIRSHGKKISMIDYGWSFLQDKNSNGDIFCSVAPITHYSSPFNISNLQTDFSQLAYDFLHVCNAEIPYTKHTLHENLDKYLRLMTRVITGSGKLDINPSNRIKLFYGGISTKTVFMDKHPVLDIFKSEYKVSFEEYTNAQKIGQYKFSQQSFFP